MVPVWVIRASRTVFALRPNRKLPSNVCHKRPSSIVISIPFFHPLLSTLILSIRNPSTAPSRRPSPPLLTILHIALFSDLAARLEESDRLATVPIFFSVGRLRWIPSILVESSYSSLCTYWVPPIHASLNFYPQRNGDEYTSSSPLIPD